MAWTKRTCAGALEEPQLAVTMVKTARANVKGRAFSKRDIKRHIRNSPKAFGW
jgi:hypothetical protein